jgi:hypothetical protein
VLSTALALVSLTAGFGAVDLVSPWVLHEGTQVTDVGFGTLTGLGIPIALFSQTRRPASQATGIWQLGAAALAFLVAGLLAGERGLLVAAAAVAAAAAAVVALQSDRSRLLRGLGRPRLPMLVLALAACAPGSQYALHMAFNQRNGVLPADAHLGLQHWAALSAAALAAFFTALLASLRREAFTTPGLTAAAAVLAWGAACLAYPHAAGSLSPAWAWPTVAWAALFALATVREHRRATPLALHPADVASSGQNGG